MSPLDVVVDWNSTSMDPTKKMVVITSRLLSDAHRYILRCLSAHQTVLCCTIFTSISEIAHSAYVDSPLGPDAFREYESLLLQDYEEIVRKSNTKDHISPPVNEFRESPGSKCEERLVVEDEGWLPLASNEEDVPSPVATSTGRDLDEVSSMSFTQDGWPKLVVSVHHFPMILCPLSPRVFVLPSEGTIAESCFSNDHEDCLSPGLPPINTGVSSDGEDIPPGAIQTAHFLYHLVTKMDLKMEIFSLGDLSKSVGKILTDMSSLYDVGRRNKRSAGLLLIDRTLDLMTPCCHGDSLIDRMLSSLPRRERMTSAAHTKGPQLQNKHASVSLQRAPLDVQIPLGRIFSEEPATGGIRLLESIAAVASGWASSDPQSQPIDSVYQNMKHSEIDLLNGSFVSTDNFQGAHYLEAILDRKTRDAALLVRKWLQETLRREKIPLNMKIRPGVATAPELHAMVKLLASNQASFVRNKGIIQLAVAAEIALSEPHRSRWDTFISAERILSVSAGDSQNLSGQIRDLIHKSMLAGPHERGLLSFRDVLILAVVGYMLAGGSFSTSGSGGPFSWEEEHSLKEAIVDAVLENPAAARFQFLHGLEEELEANLKKLKSEEPKEAFSGKSTPVDFDDQWGSWDDEDTDQSSEQVYSDMQLRLELRDRVDHIFKMFHKLSGLKRRNPSFKEGLLAFESNSGSDSYTSRGLLYKLLTMVLGNYDIPGLEYHSSVVGRFFKSGFGRFGLGQAKPKLGEQNVLLVFVVGGINGLEVREAWEAASESGRPDVELILGGTTLLTPDDMFDLLLGSSSYF
ncbi:sec1 family domain-containing protein MIP3 isoform X2 [Magnolia sinica]|nr:sec1 family domain-containing protein MIP3 isoform X2 [Magnolia sinica]